MDIISSSLIEKYREEIRMICEQNHLKALYFFGSILDPSRFNSKSDVDILVEFDEDHLSLEAYTDSYFNLVFALEDLLKREVDIVTVRSIKNPYFKAELEATKQLFYELVPANG